MSTFNNNSCANLSDYAHNIKFLTFTFTFSMNYMLMNVATPVSSNAKKNIISVLNLFMTDTCILEHVLELNISFLK